jgi:hypothetical protein
MTNIPYSISGKNSPKRSIFSPKPTEKCSYMLVMQRYINKIAFSKQSKVFSKDAKGQMPFNSQYQALNSPYFIESSQFITHNSSFIAHGHTKF